VIGQISLVGLEPSAGSQSAQILAHLRQGNSLTPLEALDRFGCLRLAARIADLRALGWSIEATPWSTGRGKSVASYRLVSPS